MRTFFIKIFCKSLKKIYIRKYHQGGATRLDVKEIKLPKLQRFWTLVTMFLRMTYNEKRDMMLLNVTVMETQAMRCCVLSKFLNSDLVLWQTCDGKRHYCLSAESSVDTMVRVSVCPFQIGTYRVALAALAFHVSMWKGSVLPEMIRTVK